MKKYIAQQTYENFVYPNNNVQIYDNNDIVQNINNNNITGVVNSLNYSLLTTTGATFTYNLTWNRNGGEDFIRNDGKRAIASIEMLPKGQLYYQPWRTVAVANSTDVSSNSVTVSGSFSVTPTEFGLPSTGFTEGNYIFQVKFIGSKTTYVVDVQTTAMFATPTPTPTPTVTPTLTPTPSPTPTITPTPTPAPIGNCYCFDIHVTGTTVGEGGVIASLDYNDCYGVRTVRNFTIGPGVYHQCIQYYAGTIQIFESSGIDTSPIVLPGSGNCNTGYVCSGYQPDPTVTPTPTPTVTTTYTYLAACSGGTIVGYITGSYSSSVQMTIGGTCYVTAYTTTSPSIGSLITGDRTLGTCCPTPTPTPTPVPVGYGVYTGATFASAGLACGDSNYPSVTLYIANGDTISNGDTLYINPGLTGAYPGNGQYYHIYKDSTQWAAQISSGGVVSNLIVCSTITPTPTPTATATPTLIEFTISKGNAGTSGSGTACANYPVTNPYTVYNVGGYLSEGDTVYSDALGTIPFAGGPGSGYYYSDGSEYGRINNSGVYTNAGYCTL